MVQCMQRARGLSRVVAGHVSVHTTQRPRMLHTSAPRAASVKISPSEMSRLLEERIAGWKAQVRTIVVPRQQTMAVCWEETAEHRVHNH